MRIVNGIFTSGSVLTAGCFLVDLAWCHSERESERETVGLDVLAALASTILLLTACFLLSLFFFTFNGLRTS